MFLTGVIIFAVTSATAGLAQDPAMLIGSRAIQGIGAALDDAGDPLDHHPHLPAAERGRAIGIWAGVSALALSIGPVVGGALTEYVSWRAISSSTSRSPLERSSPRCSLCASRATRRSTGGWTIRASLL